MKTAFLVFPHQLFKTIPVLPKGTVIYLIEEQLFFLQYNFHKVKIAFHRASMQAYRAFLEENNHHVIYVDSTEADSDVRKLLRRLAAEKFEEITFAEVYDDWLKKRIEGSCKKYDLKIKILSSPYFLNRQNDGNEWTEKNKKYFHHNFYIAQRKKNRILVDAKDQPTAGKWSFDEENRKKIPAKHLVEIIPFVIENEYHTEALEYVEQNFKENYGESGKIFYPITHVQAENWLEEFLVNRFMLFGDYEDAIQKTNHQLYHSMLSPLLNVGLLTPKLVIDKALIFAEKQKIAINSVEGFVRQIIGWREFMPMVYTQIGAKQRTKNFWGFKRKIPSSFWKGTTGIDPVDMVIKEVLETGYCHHIERLMILGNFMLLCEFDPDEVYKWFMELFIDSYDWVMVPNVYGMSQFADGGLMITKPYISGSNYIIKMSDYKKGDWSEIWDSLFWRFMDVHREVIQKNPRLGMLIKTFDKMPVEKREKYQEVSETFLNKL